VEFVSEVVNCAEQHVSSTAAPVWRVGMRFEVPSGDAQRDFKTLLAQLMMEYWSLR
jgi:hypothetical protein